MGRMREYTVGEFLGLNERGSPTSMGGSGTPNNSARILENLRREGGILDKVKGHTVHSIINYKAADRPVSLIRFSSDVGTNSFIATAWDNILFPSGDALPLAQWSPILRPEDSTALIPKNLLYYINQQFDWFIYRDTLYLTDGLNDPMKIMLGSTGFSGSFLAGTWGYKRFSAATSVLTGTVQIAGALANDDYKYKATLYDSTRLLESNIEDSLFSITTGAVRDVWVHTNMGTWAIADNYDLENEFADQLRIYRIPDVGGAAEGAYHLVGAFKKGLISSGDSVMDIVGGGATGVGTHIGANFITDGVTAGDVIYVNIVGGGWNIYQITARSADTITMVASTGGNFGGVGQVNKTYRIFGGLIDNSNDISTNETYFGDLDVNPEDHGVLPPCKYCTMFGDKGFRAFVAGNPTHPDRIYYSEEDLPDYFPGVDEVEGNWFDVDPDDGDRITALIKFQGRLYVFKRNSVAIVDVDGSPFEWTTTARVLSVGATEKRLIADCGGVLIFANTTGVYMWNGGELTNLSHPDTGSNIIDRWEKVVKTELYNGQSIYHKKRNEYWLAVTLDDERGLYDSSRTGKGTIQEASHVVGADGNDPPQNNMVLVYNLEDGQWTTIPFLHPSALVVFRGEGDQDELYSGATPATVFTEESSEGVETTDGESGQATGGAATTLVKTLAGWTVDEFIGYTLYKYSYLDGSLESCTVASNTIDTLTGTAGSFSGVNPDAWEANPVATDYFLLLLEGSSDMRLRYRTPMIAVESLHKLKAFIEMAIDVIGTGRLDVAWTMDRGKEGGLVQFNLSQGTTGWGTHSWGAIIAADGSTMAWTAVEATLVEAGFPANAEGIKVEFEFTVNTSNAFKLFYWLIGYHINTGTKWAR